MAVKKKAVRKPKAKTEPAARGVHAPANTNEAKLSSRPMWQGQLRLSLVSCPVALYNEIGRAHV